jgi:hypothetical protein
MMNIREWKREGGDGVSERGKMIKKEGMVWKEGYSIEA